MWDIWELSCLCNFPLKTVLKIESLLLKGILLIAYLNLLRSEKPDIKSFIYSLYLFYNLTVSFYCLLGMFIT